MEVYKTIYSWRVLEAIREGKTVYALDKEKAETYSCNALLVCDLVALTKAAEQDDTGRYLFWATEEQEDNKE